MKVVFIFSEGAHDVAFIKLVIEWSLSIKHEENIKICDLPKPINEYFQKNMENRNMGDLSLNMANKFFLPNFVFKKDDTEIFLFNSGGEKHISDLKIFLADTALIVDNYDASFAFSKNDISYLFTYDADFHTPKDVITKMNDLLFPISNKDSSFYYGEPEIEMLKKKQLDFNTYSAQKDNISFYIWSENTTSGTLEDILFPVFSADNPKLITQSSLFVKENFPKLQYTSDITEHNITRKAKTLKATYTIAGQGEKPERPLSAILMDHVLCKEDTFINNIRIKDFSEFLSTIIG